MTRDEKGRFAKGNPGGPGRSKREVEHEYHTALIGRVSIADWQKIIDRAVRDAMHGDAVARKWLSDQLMGTPVQRTEISGANGNMLEIALKWDDNDGEDQTAEVA